MQKEVIHVEGAHPAGNVAGIKAGGFLWYSAFRGAGADVQEQARNALESLKVQLAAAGASLEHVVKATIYFQNIADRVPFHEVWMEYFGVESPPARIAVEVSNASPSPNGISLFAFDAVAIAPD
jgi:enamine deaminase RidA (YjgF/YER057c/UK114 family)